MGPHDTPAHRPEVELDRHGQTDVCVCNPSPLFTVTI
jgi:hypothetical protein